jgi:PAS domain S-box-containing protein
MAAVPGVRDDIVRDAPGREPGPILLAGGDAARGLGASFAPEGQTTVHAAGLDDACAAARQQAPALIVLDPALAGADDAVRALREAAPGAVLVLLAGDGRQEALAALRAALLPDPHDLRSLYEQSLDGILLTAPDGSVLAANPAACRMFGYTEDEFRTLGRAAVVDPDDPRLAAALDERRRTGRFQGELTFVRKDGSRIPVEVSTRVFRDADGAERTSMFIRDATERKRAEEALAASERRYRGLVQGLHDGVFLCDAQNRIVEATPRFGEMLGYDVEEMVGMAVDALVQPEDLARAALRRQELRRTGRLVSERLLRRRDGGALPVEIASVLLENGRVECVVRDVTERRRAEREQHLLAEAGELFTSSLEPRQILHRIAELAVEAFADWCIIDVLAPDGTLETVEFAAADPRKADVLRALLERYPHSASPERHPVGRVLQTGEPVLAAHVDPALLGQSAVDAEHAGMMREMDPRSFLVVALVARGRILGALALATSERAAAFDARDLELAQELARRTALAVEKGRLVEKLREAVQARDHVLAYVAHDLRSPLGGIGLLAEMLLRTPGTEEERRRSLESILQAAGQIDRLIQDLLDATRIDAGRLRLHPEPEEVGPIVREALLTLAPAAADAGVEVRLDVPARVPRVMADRDRLLQVLNNLLSNAVKFTPRGGTVTVGLRPAKGELVFSVVDTGRGIAAPDLPRLFDRFWQAEQTRRGGTGLGLAIARGIVEGHGGRIWAESVPGRGSTFSFTLPLGAGAPAPPRLPEALLPPRPAPAPVRAEAPAGKVRVLLADDHPTLRRGLRELLGREPWIEVVGEAATGEDAVRQAEALAPDVVVMDLAMPVMDGLEAMRRITAAGDGVRVLALTAEAEDEAVPRVLEAGGCGLVRKSTAHRDLPAAIRAVAGGQLFLDPAGSQLVLKGFREGVRRAFDDPLAALSPAERQVALLTAEGFTSREIGRRLHLSPRTVDSHRSHLMKKLGLEHRAELVRLVLRAGLLRAE